MNLDTFAQNNSNLMQQNNYSARIFEKQITRAMITKLTLTMNKKVIESAKKHAKKNGKSLSSMIESYLKTIVTKEEATHEISPTIQSLMGIAQVGPDFDEKKEMRDAMIQKHLR